jgi:alkylated DNA nucleotide flippase Atl1
LAFSRIRAEVFAAVCAIPSGRITTYAEIGRHLEVMPRHVAYMLAAIDDVPVEVPWHRVVAEQGSIRSPRRTRQAQHAQRLKAEGIAVNSKGQMEDLSRRFFQWPVREEGPVRPSRRPYSDPETPPVFPLAVKFGYPLSGPAKPASQRRRS